MSYEIGKPLGSASMIVNYTLMLPILYTLNEASDLAKLIEQEVQISFVKWELQNINQNLDIHI
jgi:hypothetical protein